MKKDGNSLALVTSINGGARTLASFAARSGVISASLQVAKLNYTNGNPTIRTQELKFYRDGGTGPWILSRNRSDSTVSRADTRSAGAAIGRKRGRPKKSRELTQESTNLNGQEEKQLELSPSEANSENP